MAELENVGYRRYEVSSWARIGKECIHNLNYWKNGDYIGLGVAAGGHIGRLRYVNSSSLENYTGSLKKGFFSRDYELNNDELEEVFETLFMGLRLLDGIPVDTISGNDALVKELVAKIECRLSKYILVENNIIHMTSLGLDLSRSVLEELLGIKEEMEDVFCPRDS